MLAGAGCALLLLGTFLPYVDYGGAGGDFAVFDVDHLDVTWAGGLSYLVAAGTVVVAAAVCRSRLKLFGAFSIGVGIVAFLDFLGAFVIAPTTYEGSVDLGPGGIVGSVGSGLLVAAGVVAFSSPPAVAVQPAAAVSELGLRGGWSSRRTLLVGVFTALAVNGTLGIIAIALGDFGDPSDIEVKAVGSSLSITVGALVALASIPALRRRTLRPVAYAGVLLAILGFGMVFTGVWGQWSSTQFWKIASTLVVSALACGWACLLAIARLPAFHPLRVSAFVSVLAFGVTSIAGIWALTADDTFWRLFGSLGLVLTSVTVAVIVLGGRRPSVGADPAAASAAL
jgi:hypothetical protein